MRGAAGGRDSGGDGERRRRSRHRQGDRRRHERAGGKARTAGVTIATATRFAGTAAPVDDRDARSVSVVIQNHNGLHVRPASKLVAALAGFNADLVLEKGGKCVTPDSLNQIALLQVRRNDTLRLLARGPDADAALAAFQALAAENFGEPTEAAPARRPASADRVEGKVVLYPQPQDRISRETSAAIVPAAAAAETGHRPDAGRP